MKVAELIYALMHIQPDAEVLIEASERLKPVEDAMVVFYLPSLNIAIDVLVATSEYATTIERQAAESGVTAVWLKAVE